MHLILRSAAATDRGPVRPNNEDSAFAGRRLAVVADGIGGLPDGERASGIAIEVLAPLETAETSDPAGALARAVENANILIEARGQDMGTTVTAVLLAGDRLGLLHVGDSRAYLLAAGASGVVRLTRDDTFVQQLVDTGALTAEQARGHPRRSLITQAVKGEPYRASVATVPVEAGDRVLLCSDGLSDYLDDHAIGEVLRTEPDPAACAGRLVALALAVPTNDNVTAVIADVVAE
jgi:PPM family protein phosphatase